MKNIIAVIFLCFSINVIGSSILYRVQLGTYKKGKTPSKLLNKSFISTFTLPQEYNAYFSGGYFKNYLGAKLRLQTMQENNFPKARLRVFKNGKLLSLIDGQKIIANAEIDLEDDDANNKNINNQIYSIRKRATLKNRIILFDEIDQEVPSDSVLNKITKDIFKQKSFYQKLDLKSLSFKSSSNKEEEESQGEDQTADFSGVNNKEELPEVLESEKTEFIEKENIETKQNLDKEINKDNSQLIAKETIKELEEIETIEKPKKEIIEISIEEEKANKIAEAIILANEKSLLNEEFDKNSELPIFKIYLSSNLKNKSTPLLIENLTDIVYLYEQQESILYTVGYFESSNKATNELGRYTNQGFDKAKVIGIYKGIIISKEIAEYIIKKSLGEE